MNRMLLPAVMALGAVTVASQASAAEVQVQAQGPVVDLSVTKSVKSAPDIVAIGAGVNSTAPTAVAAMQTNATAMDAVVKRIKSLGIDAKDIQTAGISLNADYDYDQVKRQQVFKGYRASNRVNVTLRDVKRAGPVLDALVAAGANDISGPDFSIEDDAAAKAQARKAAFAELQERAQEYAKWAGYSGVRLLQVGEAVMNNRPMPMMKEMAVTQDASAAPTPVEPGLVGTSVTVTASFEMTR